VDAFGAVTGTARALAYLLGATPEQVVVRWLDHSGQYGAPRLAATAPKPMR